MDLADSDIEAKVPNSEHTFHASWKKLRYAAGWCEMLVNSDKRYLLACVTLEQKQHLELLLGSRLGIFSSCSKSLVRGSPFCTAPFKCHSLFFLISGPRLEMVFWTGKSRLVLFSQCQEHHFPGSHCRAEGTKFGSVRLIYCGGKNSWQKTSNLCFSELKLHAKLPVFGWRCVWCRNFPRDFRNAVWCICIRQQDGLVAMGII